VLDAGGQYCHLIARRVRDLGVYAEVRPSETAARELTGRKGLIISGGPSSVYDPGSPTVDPGIFADEHAVLGISTSGASANVNRGLRRARERGALTIGFTGRDGGAMVDLCQFCFVVPSWSIHRIQETHTLLLHLLWDQVHVALGEDDVL